MNLTEAEVRWVRRKWDKIRASQMEADKANTEWQEINASINRKHEAEDFQRAKNGRPLLTDLMKAEAKDASLPLKDALATGNWHSRNAERHIHDVTLFLRLKELGIL